MNTLRIRNLIGCIALSSLSVLSAQVRTSYTLEKGWRFTREDNRDFVKPGYDDARW